LWPALLACGVALALIILAFPLAAWLFGKGSSATSGADGPNAGQAAVAPANLTGVNAAPPPAQSSASEHAAEDPFAPRPASPAEPSSATTAGKLPRKVLLVIPSRGLWVNDYRWLADAFAQLNIPLEVASTTHGPITDLDGNEKPVTVDILVQDADVSEYGAIIFAGYRTEEYMDGGVARDDAKRLIDGALASDRFVAGICVGQRALAHHGALNKKRRAHSHYFQRDFPDEQRGAPQQQTVVRDGQIFTAGSDGDAKQLAQAIASALDE
jgi:eukaryotic-like serine/threonine-protein kinase